MTFNQELRRAIEGLVVMSEMLEDMYSCIFEGRVPVFWQKGCNKLDFAVDSFKVEFGKIEFGILCVV